MRNQKNFLALFFPFFLLPLSSFLMPFLFPPFLSITLERVQVVVDQGQPNWSHGTQPEHTLWIPQLSAVWVSPMAWLCVLLKWVQRGYWHGGGGGREEFWGSYFCPRIGSTQNKSQTEMWSLSNNLLVWHHFRRTYNLLQHFDKDAMGKVSPKHDTLGL